ncbi:hypothetical protein IEU95_05775 [Hoyosella rhizosphaerae]|uniref:Uncharacterized protein n=1 Tax=Hoyosella rhizosphaerae TaxID=1755582 RepID=A0A916U5Q6_9ACTN|nr:hypothetical protein [Hoyosella rhizosphaerae]MBN4926330.1 hypothetical protein [Hoyosella rhizosphaerae]GGC60191.1 hypothetical protein GCM10011410_10840 [Hoyosella rhizosphaerae]
MSRKPTGSGHFFRDLHGRVTDAITRLSDPREKHIRKTRKAKRRSVRFGTTSGVAGGGTVALAISSAPDWTVITGGGITALCAVPAVMAWQRFRKYKAEPLPPIRPQRRFHPGYTSAAYDPLLRLGDVEQSLYRLLTVLSRSHVVPHDEIEEISVVSTAAADALESAARDIVEMEHAQRSLRGSSSHVHRQDLSGPIEALVDRINSGVAEVQKLAETATVMTQAAFGPQPAGPLEQVDNHRAQLRDAVDRLEGLTYGLRELHTVWTDAPPSVGSAEALHPTPAPPTRAPWSDPIGRHHEASIEPRPAQPKDKNRPRETY